MANMRSFAKSQTPRRHVHVILNRIRSFQPPRQVIQGRQCYGTGSRQSRYCKKPLQRGSFYGKILTLPRRMLSPRCISTLLDRAMGGPLVPAFGKPPCVETPCSKGAGANWVRATSKASWSSSGNRPKMFHACRLDTWSPM